MHILLHSCFVSKSPTCGILIACIHTICVNVLYALNLARPSLDNKCNFGKQLLKTLSLKFVFSMFMRKDKNKSKY